MSKRNIAYVKPEEPNFIKKLKQELGFKEGPTIETKREKLPELNGHEDDDLLDYQPAVVVLNPGDLTAEEVEIEQNKLIKESELIKADLNKPVVFRPTTKSSSRSAGKTGKTKKGDDKTDLKKASLLSFDVEEEEN